MGKRTGWGRAALGLLAAGLLAGCAPGGDDGDGVEATLDSLWEARLKGCGECHGPPPRLVDTGPDMTTQTAFLALRDSTPDDYPGWERAGNCIIPLIDPENPGNSLVITSLIEEKSTQLVNKEGCTSAFSSHETLGETLHPTNDADLIDALTTWIADGAQDN